MEITATELKLNLGKYLEASNDEEVIITKNGKAIARLIGAKRFKYDLSELVEWEAKIKENHRLGEAPAPGYGTSGAGATDASDPGDTPADLWMLTHNGEPVAQLTPVLKEKKKRRLGFISGPPTSEETIEALLESDFSDEDYERWLNEKW
jgi:prevent-host-death family protein